MGFMVQQVGSIPAISHNIKIGKNMLKEEFEKLIKREVNENQYKNINRREGNSGIHSKRRAAIVGTR